MKTKLPTHVRHSDLQVMLRELLDMAEAFQKAKDPSFVSWPDAHTMTDYICELIENIDDVKKIIILAGRVARFADPLNQAQDHLVNDLCQAIRECPL